MTFGQLISVLRARWWVALLVFLLTCLGTLGVSLMLPKKYTATASVVIDVKPDPVTAMLYGGMLSPAMLATQVDIIKSDRVAQRVVSNLKLAENPQIRQQWLDEGKGQGRIEGWLANSFQRSLDVEPSRESSVINVSYTAQDPRFAAALANAFVQAYVETSLQLRVDPARQYSTFFESRAQEAREALERAQSKVSAFQSSNRIIATDERFDVENARLNELSSQYTVLQALSAESRSRQTAARSEQADRMQEVLNNSIVAQLKADLNRSEARLKELSTRLGDAHPLVQEQSASILELRRRLDAETIKVTGGVVVSNTINEQRTAEVKASLEAQRTKILRLKGVRDEGAVLFRDVENAQRAYDVVFQRANQSNIEGQTTQSNVNVLQQAFEPSAHSSPKLMLNMVIATVVGFMLAIAAALLLELRDRRVRNFEDVNSALGLPVLGVMPKPGILPRLSRTNSLLQQRLLTPLAGPSVGAT